MEDKYNHLIVNNQNLEKLLNKQKESLEVLDKLLFFQNILRIDLILSKRILGDRLDLSFKSINDIRER